MVRLNGGEMSTAVGRSRRPWCYHKRGISLDDNIANNSDFTLDEEEDNNVIMNITMKSSEDREDESQEVEDDESLQSRFGRLLSCEDMADIHFLVGSHSRQLRIPAHRLVLSIGSQVFKQMFYSSSFNNSKEDEEEEEEREREDEISLPEVDPQSFLEFLRHFYCDSTVISKESVIPVLYLGKRYKVLSLERKCLYYCRHSLDGNNCVMIWLFSKKFKESEIERIALKVVEKTANTSLLTPDLLKADLDSIKQLLNNDLLRISELQLFIAVTRWAKNTCLRKGICPTRANIRLILSDSIDLIRFPLMSEEEIRGRVSSEGLLEEDILRSLLSSHRTWPRVSRSLNFNSNPRAFQRLLSPLLTVQRFQSFDNQLSNKASNVCLSFSSSNNIFLSAVGVYGPRKACPFFIQISLSITRSDKTSDPTVIDRIESQTLLKCDGSQPIITIKLEEPFEIESNVFYDIRASLCPTNRLTGSGGGMKARLNPHLFYSRPQEVNYYYGVGPLLAAKVKREKQNSIVFNFSNFDSNSLENNDWNSTQVCSQSSSAPPTPAPAPPPRPPPPKEYRRPSRIERLKRALSFSDKNQFLNSFGEDESHVSISGGQIPVLLFFA